jgi:regulator of sigma E protease
MQILLFILAILLFISLVIVHEWGHYIVARRNGVEVEEFGLGFPPRAWGKKRKDGMILSLNWLPLGGFVKLKGEFDADTRKGSFGAASLGAKTRVLLAGVTMNLLVGLALLTVLAWVGMPKLINKDVAGQDQFTVKSDTKVLSQEVRVGSVQDNSPASKAGLASKDVIESIAVGNNVHNVKTSGQLHNTTAALAGKTVQITYKHAGSTITKKGLGHAIGGLGSTIAGLVTGNHKARENGQTAASSQVGGPVAIVAVLWGSGSYGITFILWIIAVISLTLALMNVLPIPALDGGRLFMILMSRGVFKKPLSRMMEERITATGMAVLLALIVLITIVDVKRFF